LEEDFPQSSFCSGGIRFCTTGKKICKTTADQHPRGALRVYRIPLEQKPDRLLSGKFPSLQKSVHAGATLSGTPLLQRAVELGRRSLIFLRCPPEPPLAEMALRTRKKAILNKFDLKMNFKLQIKV
jgi:hypothetical protein